jgi:hypothetical protein
MPRALITGITGQDGSYLAELLLGSMTMSRLPNAASAASIDSAPNRASRSRCSTLRAP